jgi:hypothetical protein
MIAQTAEKQHATARLVCRVYSLKKAYKRLPAILPNNNNLFHF